MAIDITTHTAGHISLYIPEIKTLVAADALVIENGELEIANPQCTLDIKTAIESVKKIAGLKIKKLICYHGGMMETGIDSPLKGLLKNMKRLPKGSDKFNGRFPLLFFPRAGGWLRLWGDRRL